MDIRERRYGKKIAAVLIAVLAAICICALYSPANTETVAGELYAAPAATERSIANLVIFICFSDENIATVRSSIGAGLISSYTGSSNSLADYYSTISYGKINIRTLFPETGSGYYVYQDSQTRSYYYSVKKNTDGNTRARRESELLNNAVNAAKSRFDLTDINLDTDGDGYCDSVSFLISGTYNSSSQSDWGGLLWPHSANLHEYTQKVNGTPATIGGIKVGDFTFNFIKTVDTGLICHETGHVLGMPDLYHYFNSKDYYQVGEWDLMHKQASVPQYPSVYLRDKYLNVIDEDQIVELKSSGEYTLRAVSTATENDVIACKIKISDYEEIWMEYRNKDAAIYDSSLPRSGLIVYRTDSRAKEGNVYGDRHSTAKPDEVYMYRPSVSNSSDVKTKEEADLKYAALGTSNRYFSSLGGKNYTSAWDSRAVFLTDGSNTGIVIEVREESDDTVTFYVDVDRYGSRKVQSLYVAGKPEINFGETPSVTLKVKFFDFPEYVTADPSSYRIVYDPDTTGEQHAQIVYTDDEGQEIVTVFTLKINDLVQPEGVEIARNPTKRSYDVGDRIDLSGLKLTVKYVSGRRAEVEYSEINAHNWSVTGVNMNLSGEYYMIVTYIPFDVGVRIKVTVMSELASIRVSDRNTTTIIDENGTFIIGVEGVNRDGTVRMLSSSDYSITKPYSKELLYQKQTITVTATAASSIKCSFDCYVVRMSELRSVTKATAPTGVLKYGQTLDLTGGSLKFTFAGGQSVTVPMNNYFNVYDGQFDPTRTGTQALELKLGEVSDTLNVTVLTPDESILIGGTGASVNVRGGYVLLDGGMDIAAAESVFRSYLDIRFTVREAETEYTISSDTHEGAVLNDGTRIILTNSAGQAIVAFKVYVIGDVNGDGRADADDMAGWAAALGRTDINLPCLDLNGDGRYTLTDFVLLAERFCK